MSDQVKTEEQEKSELLEGEYENLPPVAYTDDERKYISRLLQRFEYGIIMREQMHVELDGMTYSEYWDMNERLGNTFIEPKKNKEDSTYQSGTPRNKMMALVAAVNNLNLSCDLGAYDKTDVPIAKLGDMMEDIILKTEQEDNDDEKKMLRQYEMMKQGDVFVEEVQDERWMMDKKIQAGGKFTGQITGISWTQKLKKLFSRPSRNILPGLSVVLGNIRQYFLNLQPYIFTIEIKDYYETASIYGQWERWNDVPKVWAAPRFRSVTTIYDNAWKVMNIEAGQCVIIKYQDPWNNEYGLLINNVLMTPVGLPLTAVNGYAGYNITQQHLEPLHPNFGYGGSLMKRLRTQAGILDEMLRMGVLKSQRSYAPSLLNMSGRILSRKIFTPGFIANGIPKDSVVPLLKDMEGINQSELEMVNLIKADIDNSTINPNGMGQQGKNQQTATETVELARQAKIVLGLTIFACALLEWKLTWLRIYNILAKWFDPIDTTVDEVRKELVNRYRTASVPRPIPGKGMGRRMVVPMKGALPDTHQVKDIEAYLSNKAGTPLQIIFVDVDAIKEADCTWEVTIRPREKDSSEMSKLLFRAEMGDAALLAPMGARPNPQYFAEKFSRVWQEDPKKAFDIVQMPNPNDPNATKDAAAGGAPSPVLPAGAGGAPAMDAGDTGAQ